MEAFKVFDQDGSGKISLEELRNVMLSLGEDLTDQQLRKSLKEHEKSSQNALILLFIFLVETCRLSETIKFN